jgi:hypothetical protein
MNEKRFSKDINLHLHHFEVLIHTYPHPQENKTAVGSIHDLITFEIAI